MANPPAPDLSRIQAFFATGRKLTYNKNELLIRAFDDPLGMHYIEAGLLKVYSINNRGEEYLHIVYGPGDIFPLPWLMNAARRNVFYEALTSLTVFRAGRDDVLHQVLNDPEFSYALLEQTIRQFNLYNVRVDNLEYKFARERLAYSLVFLANRFGIKDGDTYMLPPLTQQDIASMVNLSRESASRELERLHKKGIITYQDRAIIVNDLPKLHEEVGGSIAPDLWGHVDARPAM